MPTTLISINYPAAPSKTVVSRGNTIQAKLTNEQNLLIAPEYGGTIRFHRKTTNTSSKHNLKVDFLDQLAFTVTLAGMGVIKTLQNDNLISSFIYRQDFSATPRHLTPTSTLKSSKWSWRVEK
jgi:hypothetical protein